MASFLCNSWLNKITVLLLGFDFSFVATKDSHLREQWFLTPVFVCSVDLFGETYSSVWVPLRKAVGREQSGERACGKELCFSNQGHLVSVNHFPFLSESVPLLRHHISEIAILTEMLSVPFLVIFSLFSINSARSRVTL